jgi:hypothetical protein
MGLKYGDTHRAREDAVASASIASLLTLEHIFHRTIANTGTYKQTNGNHRKCLS